MISIGRGQSNTPDRLRLFIVDGDGAAFNPFLVQYRIFDVTTGTPVQVFPPSGSKDVTTGPGRFDAGSFYAYDVGGYGWTPNVVANLGNWYIEWDVQLTSGDAVDLYKVEPFAVVANAGYSTPDPLYVSVADFRAEGIPNPPLASKLEADIRVWQSFLVRVCRQWFHPVHLELLVDGTDSDALHFGVPIINVDELRINNVNEPLAPSYYRVYKSERYPDNKANPRIKLIDEFSQSRDIFTAPMTDGRRCFRKGRQNQYISGTFGCVEADGSPPPLIKRALMKLVVEKLGAPVYSGSGVTPPAALAGVVQEEWTDGHKIKYDTSGTATKPRASGLTGITNDPEVLGIIRLFRAPIGLATPNDPTAS